MIRLIQKIWIRLTNRLDGFWAEIKPLFGEAWDWRCADCDSRWGRVDNYCCYSCRQARELALSGPKPAFHFTVSHRPAIIQKKTHFDLCNQSVEIPLQMAYLEERGKLKAPGRMQWAKNMIEKSKNQETIDYQKHGHPSLNKDFKHPGFDNLND